MRALVVYESMFGDNQQVARAIAAGLVAAGRDAEAVEVGVAPQHIGSDVSLLVVGSPNHAWSLPRPSTRKDAAEKADGPLVSQGIGVREWLDLLSVDAGVRTAAYDTRGSHPKAVVRFDHASTSIEKALARLGGHRVAPAEHFLVADMKGPLEPGEIERAQAWGATLSGALDQ
ncbi:MAG: hypothetical protein R2737_00045 [Candidatus Nanopelagicales bacterium]